MVLPILIGIGMITVLLAAVGLLRTLDAHFAMRRIARDDLA